MACIEHICTKSNVNAGLVLVFHFSLEITTTVKSCMEYALVYIMQGDFIAVDGENVSSRV